MLAVKEWPSQSQKYCVSGLQRSVRRMHVHASPQPAGPAQTSPRPQSRDVRHWPGARGAGGVLAVVLVTLVLARAVVLVVVAVAAVLVLVVGGRARVVVVGGGAGVSATATASSQLPWRA